jgi:asparagine synthetase B (glutamine-hydrolysing)
MCSFIGIMTENKGLLDELEKRKEISFSKLKHRGPDIHTFRRIEDNILLCGFVLAIKSTVAQPISGPDSHLLWNGEIYNCPPEYDSDTKFLLDYFNNDGLEKIHNIAPGEPGKIISSLDGEYAISFIKDGLLHLITDDFFTKPLCYYLTDDILIYSSYESAIKEVVPEANVTHGMPNTHYIFDIKKKKLLSQREIYKWDFQPRYDTYELWNESYSLSVTKRCNTSKKLFLPLSSGYDSGGICSEVLYNDVACTMYSYVGIENKEILRARQNLIHAKGNKHLIIDPRVNFENNFRDFANKVENWIAYHYDGTPFLDIYHAYSCFAHFLICTHAKRTGHDVCLSGHGADEIYSDYYSPRTKGVSVVGGDYTGWRKKWPNFDMGYGRNILGMFDRAAAAAGVETRYPYLDKETVQNFLWLTDELKNKNYKQCQHQIMKKRKFPFDEENLKVGLRIFSGDSTNEKFKYFLKSYYEKNKIQRPEWIAGY